jgi:signal peptidase I
MSDVQTGPALERKPDESSRLWLALIIPMALLGGFVYIYAATRLPGLRTFSISSTAMETTLLPGDHLIADMDYYKSHKPTYGDVLIYQRGRTFFIKRVVAASGSTILGQDGHVVVDGKELTEPYVVHTASSSGETLSANLSNFGPITIPSGKFFVMGDNRDVSYDSRQPEHGLVDSSEIKGRALYLYWPLGRLGRRIK